MIDGGLRGIFREKLKKGWDWQSVENVAGLGVPDSNFCKSGIEGWVEFKVTESFNPKIRREQVGWHIRRSIHGGRTFIAIRRKHDGGPRKGEAVDELWIHSGASAGLINDNGINSVEPLYYGTGGPANWDWTQIASILLS